MELLCRTCTAAVIPDEAAQMIKVETYIGEKISPKVFAKCYPIQNN
jgi:hypothetical protein